MAQQAGDSVRDHCSPDFRHLDRSAKPGQAETKEEWDRAGARVHGGFGPFIPVGIGIGLDAMQRLKADRHDVTVLYYDGGLPPCPCVADGIMIATQATPGQKTLVMSPEKAPPEYMAVIIAKNRKTGEAVRYTIAKEWHPKILAWRTDLDRRAVTMLA